MAATAFADLVGKLVEAMGQRLDAVKEVPEGVLLRTSDGFLFAFLEDPTKVSLVTIQRLFDDVGSPGSRLVVATPGRLPLALGTEVLRHGGTLVEAARFHELARGLGLGEYLGEEPRPAPAPSERRLLPSALQLDAVMQRGRSWLEWGVPALALRFFRQAAAMKPEFAPARIGIGQSLLGLGLVADARRAFEEVLASSPADLDARLGLAASDGASGHVEREIAAYRALLTEQPGAVQVRAHLLAALIAQSDWSEARGELTEMVRGSPEDPQLRYLLGVALEKTRDASAGAAEREKARQLGLDYERERALCEHLGLPPPPRPVPAAPIAGAEASLPEPLPTAAAPNAPTAPARSPRRRTASRPAVRPKASPRAKPAGRRSARRTK